MSKFIHVDGDDGSMTIRDYLMTNNGWIYKVPDDFSITLSLEDLANCTYIHGLLNDHKDTELVFQAEDY